MTEKSAAPAAACVARGGANAEGGRTGIGARVMRPLVRRFLESGRVPLPSMLMLEISSLCNLRCVMCAKTVGRVGTAPDRLMDWELFRKIEPLFPLLDYVDLSGVWGEAFIRPDLYLRMLAALKAHGITVRTISNGVLITADVAREIVRLGLDILTISLDAARPETYRRIRVGGEIGEIVSALTHIRGEKGARRTAAPRVEFMVLGMKDTIGELPEVVRMAGALGVSRVGLQEMVEFEGGEGQSLAWRHREIGRSWYEKARAVAGEVGVELSLIPPDQFEPPQAQESYKEADGARRAAVIKDCFFPWKMAVVTTGGDVIPCCAMFTSMGNLNEKSFEEIWRGKSYRDLRRSLLSEKPPPTCIICSARGWRTKDAGMELREARGLAALPLRRAFRRNPVLKRVKPFLKKFL
ncbi:MAG: radical SAM protein [Chlamydiota bacterium]